jgi:hypothetical protein
MVSGQTILPDCFSFPCSIGIDFLHRFVENLSAKCMEAFMVAFFGTNWGDIPTTPKLIL